MTARQCAGALSAVVGVGLTILLAFLGNTTKPPSASTQALIALLAIFAQAGSVWIFSGNGRADPTLAQRSVARLVGLAERASAARLTAEALYNGRFSVSEARQVLGQISVHLSYLEEGYLNAIDDWRVFHPRAVEEAEGVDIDGE
jgi:hypothetical protein